MSCSVSVVLQNLTDAGSRECATTARRALPWSPLQAHPTPRRAAVSSSAAGRVGYTTAAGWLTGQLSWVLGFHAVKLRPARRGHATMSGNGSVPALTLTWTRATGWSGANATA